jgi:hypothetical protein
VLRYESVADDPVAVEAPRRRRRWRRRAWVAGTILLLLLVAAVTLGVLDRRGVFHHDHRLVGPPGNRFRLTYPDDWRRLGGADLAALPRSTLAALQRKDGKGLVLIRREASAAGVSASRLARDLNAEFRRRLPDYRLVSARLLTTRSGRVFFYSYVRQKQGTLHVLALAPAGDHSYILDAVADPGARDVAAEVGRMIGSLSVG